MKSFLLIVLLVSSSTNIVLGKKNDDKAHAWLKKQYEAGKKLYDIDHRSMPGISGIIRKAKVTGTFVEKDNPPKLLNGIKEYQAEMDDQAREALSKQSDEIKALAKKFWKANVKDKTKVINAINSYWKKEFPYRVTYYSVGFFKRNRSKYFDTWSSVCENDRRPCIDVNDYVQFEPWLQSAHHREQLLTYNEYMCRMIIIGSSGAPVKALTKSYIHYPPDAQFQVKHYEDYMFDVSEMRNPYKGGKNLDESEKSKEQCVVVLKEVEEKGKSARNPLTGKRA